MYAVIFRASINELSDKYLEQAKYLRELAINKYGCVEFTSVTEDKQEIAISYWKDKESIEKWKNDPEHLQAQDLGRTEFYSSYQVQVVDVLRDYKG